MTIIAGPTATSAIVIGPISQILPPQYRFAGDDWADANAFTFTFYSVLPTFDQNGNQLTSGTPQNLTGCTFGGTVEYAPPPNPFCKPLLWMPSPVPMVGTITEVNGAPNGQAALTLPSAVTSTFRQQDPDLWNAVVAGDLSGSGALLRLQARLTDSLGMTGTMAVVPLFVF